MSFPQSTDTAISAIDAALVQEAGRIGEDIHRYIIHTSSWIDLTKQSAFPEGMGYNLQTMIYDRALPTTDAAGNNVGVSWNNFGIEEQSTTINESVLTGSQPLAGAIDQFAGAWGGDSDEPATNLENDVRSYLNFSKKLKPYKLLKAIITAPKISLDDLRFAFQRNEQLSAILELMTEATKNSWEERYRDEYDRVSVNFVPCMATGTTTLTTISDGTNNVSFEGVGLSDPRIDLTKSGAGASDVTPDAMLSNKVLDAIYQKMIRRGASANSYGMENGRPIFALICSSEVDYALQTEAGFRDDVRYNSSRVSDLIAPLGVEKAFRGYYHLIDDLCPRYNITTGKLTRVSPYITVAGVTVDNDAYETATHEVAYLHHQDVCEAQIPNPVSGSNGLTFDSVDYKGKFTWNNFKSESNPDGLVGYFRGVLASATKPLKTDFGYAFLYKRDATAAM